MIEPVIEFLIEFPRRAPVDTALFLATFVYAVLTFRVLTAAGRRDRGYVERMKRWQELLEEAARRRDKSRPSPAE